MAAFFSLVTIGWVPRELAVSDRRQTRPLTGSVHQARRSCTVRPDPEYTQNVTIKSPNKLPLHKTTETLALMYREFWTGFILTETARSKVYYFFRGGGQIGPQPHWRVRPEFTVTRPCRRGIKLMFYIPSPKNPQCMSITKNTGRFGRTR
jgi:hypothetical protein